MNLIAYECVVENGCIRLPPDAMLPEKSKVYVVVPGIELPLTAYLRSPQLADPSQAAFFKLEVTPEEADA